MNYRIIRIIFLSIFICFAQDAENNEPGEDYGKLFSKMGNTVAQSYFDPLAGNLGSAYNGVWATGFPSRNMIDLNPSVSIVGGFSYARSSLERFSAEVSMELTESLANRLLKEVDFSDLYGTDLPQFVQDEINNELQKQLITQLLQGNTEYKVSLFGPTLIGSRQDTVKLAWENQKIPLTYEYELPSRQEIAEQQGVPISEITTELGNKKQSIKGSTEINIPAQVVSIGLFGLMDGLPIIPALAPQITLGSFFGTQFVGRYVPDVQVESDAVNLGTLSYLGWSVQHDLSFWFSKWIDWHLMFIYSEQKIDAFEILELNTEKAGLMFGESWEFLGIWKLTPYLLWSYNRNKLHIDFSKGYKILKDAVDNPIDDPVDIQLEYTSPWKKQTSIGVIINLLSIIDLQAEASVGKYTDVYIRGSVGF